MRRTVARNLTVLIAVLALALGTFAAPAFAGAGLGGFGVVQFLEKNPDVQCAYFVDTVTEHTFLGIRTGQGIRVVGPIDQTSGLSAGIPADLPGGIAGCTQIF